MIRQTASAPRVLMLVENFSAPEDPRVWPEALALRDAGYRVTIISPKGSTSDTESEACIDGIRIYRYRLRGGRGIGSYLAEYGVSLAMTFWLSLKVWRRHGIDVIHAANPPDTFFLVGLFYRLFGKPYVFDQHDLTPDIYRTLFGAAPSGPIRRRLRPILHRILLVLERLSYRTAALVIVTNRSIESIAQQRGGCERAKTVVVRNGPDLNRFRPMSGESRLKLGRRFLLAYLGVMGPWDGVENALHAMHRLIWVRRRRDVALVLLGAGPSLAGLRALAADLRLGDFVRFNGWTPKADVPRFLAAADVGLVPDPRNGLNEACTLVKTMEYMAMGKPVVAFDLVETRVSAQNAALYARPNSVEDFADCIERLLDNDGLRITMGRVGRLRVEEALGWQHSRRELVAAYARTFGSVSKGALSVVVPNGKAEPAALMSTDSIIEVSRDHP